MDIRADRRTKRQVVGGGPLMTGRGGQNKRKKEKEASCYGLSWGLASLQGGGLGAAGFWSHLRRGLAMWARPWAQGQGTVRQEGLGQLRVPWCHTLTGGPAGMGPSLSLPPAAPSALPTQASFGQAPLPAAHRPQVTVHPGSTSDPSGPWPPPHPRPEAPPAYLMAMLWPLRAGTLREPPCDCHPSPDPTLVMQQVQGWCLGTRGKVLLWLRAVGARGLAHGILHSVTEHPTQHLPWPLECQRPSTRPQS